MNRKLIAFVTGLLFLWPVVIHSATINVPADQPTIQAGIDAATDGDTVLVHAGEYLGPGNTEITIGGKAIVIKGMSGAENTIISGWPGDAPDAFHLSGSLEDSTTIIDGFTIRYFGKGIYLDASSPTFRNLLMGPNSQGIHVAGPPCSPHFENCEIGPVIEGIHVAGSPCSLYFDDCEIISDMAGVWVAPGGSGVLIDGCTISSDDGGYWGIYRDSYVSLEVRNCSITGFWNGILSEGQDQYSSHSVLKITDCEIVNCYTGLEGGNFLATGTTIRDCVVGVKCTQEMSFSDCRFEGISEGIFDLHNLHEGGWLAACSLLNNPGYAVHGETGEMDWILLGMSGCYISNTGGISLSNDYYGTGNIGISFSMGGCELINCGTVSVSFTTAPNASIGIGGCIFDSTGVQSSAANVSGSTFRDGAYLSAGRSSSVSDCMFYDNSSAYISGTSSVSDCVFYDNSSAAVSGTSSVLDCVFYNNSSAAVSGTSSVSDCVFYNNSSSPLSVSGTTTISGCTVAGNPGAGVTLLNGPHIELQNNIIAYNEGCGVTLSGSYEGTWEFTCNDVYSNTAGDYCNLPDQEGMSGNFSLDPMFCDTAANDFHIMDVSPCALANSTCGTLIGALDVDCYYCVTDSCWAVYTPADSDVVITPASNLSLTFDSVAVPGVTQVSADTSGAPPPSGFRIIPSSPPVYYEITTTAEFVGSVTICFTYDESSITVREGRLQLFHRTGDPATWHEVEPSWVDEENNTLCGRVASLSPFMVAEPIGCCWDIRGNANGDDGENVNVSDVTYLVEYLFGIPTGPAPVCQEEGNANGDDDENVNVSDVTYLVEYLFGIPTGPAPPLCPSTGVATGSVTDHSGCLDFGLAKAVASAPPDQGCVEYEYSNNTLVLTHANAGLNCCPIIVADIRVIGSDIIIEEIDSVIAPCDCNCLFDINYVINNLPPGEYTLRVIEPYLHPEDTPLEFLIDLSEPTSGVHCEKRTHYPWAVP